MTTSDRDKFLQSVERKAILLGHRLGPWEKDSGFHAKCLTCGAVVNVKVGLRISDLSDEACKQQPRLIPSPGKPGGPHEHACGHLQCHEMMQLAGTSCAKCGRVIGFDIEFTRDANGKLHHVVCPSTQAVRERSGR